MFKFYTLLWAFWALRMFFVSLLLSSALAVLVTLFLYLKQGLPAFDLEIFYALKDIFFFWFLLLLNISIPLALFINAKYLFNHSINGVCLKLLSCPKDGEVSEIETIGYGDLVKVWRKWLLFIVWISAVFILFGAAFSYLFTSHESIFAWFSVYHLYLFIIFAGFFSIILLGSRCKLVRISVC